MILLRVLIFFLALLLLPDWYLYQRYICQTRKNWLKKIFWTPTLLLLITLIIFIIGNEYLRQHLGIYLIITLCIAVPKAFFSIFHLIGRGITYLLPILNRKNISQWSVGGNLLIAGFTCLYLIFGATKGITRFQVKEITFESADLPEAFDGYRILQLSDIHVGSWGNDTLPMQKAINICNAQQADLAVFTGDLVNSHADELQPFLHIFSKLTAKDGVYSILGNHDYATYIQWESEAKRLANIDTLIARENQIGWQMLLNEHKIIKRNNDSIAIIGVENSGHPPFPNYANLPKAQEGTDGMFKILLSHDPTHWRKEVLPQTDIALTLSGHTHDMQISLFGFSISRFIYPEHNGLYMEGKQGLYVNIGLGHVLFPMRLGAWPEITIITLKKKQ